MSATLSHAGGALISPRVRRVTEVPFSKSEVMRYTDGYCARLACSLRGLTQSEAGSPWPISGVTFRPLVQGEHLLRPDLPGNWQHVMCRTPEGLYIDVTGIHTARAVREIWEGKVRTPRDQIETVIHLLAFWQATSSKDASDVAWRIYRQWQADPSPRAFVPLSWLSD